MMIDMGAGGTRSVEMDTIGMGDNHEIRLA